MQWSEVAHIARSLEGVKESAPGRLLRWTVAGRLVARQLDEVSIVIRIDFARREQLLERYPEALFVPPRMDAHQKVVARIDHADPALITMLLNEAWLLQTS